MPEYDDKNRFVLFKNEDKQADSHPDYKGKFTDDQGREYFMDAWIKKGPNKTFMSGKVKLKDKQKGNSAPPAAAPKPSNTPVATQADQEIPF